MRNERQHIHEFSCDLRQRCPGIVFYTDISLAPFTSFQVGGTAGLLVFPRGLRELSICLSLSYQADLGITLLGGGSNVLIGDRGIPGIVLSLRLLREYSWEEDGAVLKAQSGLDMVEACLLAHRESAGGLHFFYGMPGTLGGAVYMNARCYGGEISQMVESCLVIPPFAKKEDGSFLYRPEDIREVDLEDRDWDYKDSPFNKRVLPPEIEGDYRGSAVQRSSDKDLAGSIIVSVSLRLRGNLSRSEIKGLGREMESYLEDRIVKGHYSFPCGGSFFKNDRSFGVPSAKLIDSLGLKGMRLGGAQVAPWHGNIIINRGRAKASEIWALGMRVRERVKNLCGFALMPEVERIGL